MRGKTLDAGLGRKVFGVVFAAAVMGVLTAPSSIAQTVAQVGGPAELPPNGFGGQQYVDSRGCVFMRAGFAGQTSWVPRIGADRKPLCGQVTGAEASARLQVLAQSAEPAVAAPMATIASNMQAVPRLGVVAPVAVPGLEQASSGAVMGALSAIQMPNLTTAAAQGGARPAATAAVPTFQAASAAGQALGCPAHAPVLERVALRTGGTVAVCTRGDGSATGWISPSYVANAMPGAAFRGQAGQTQIAGAQPRAQAVMADQQMAQLTAAPARDAVQYEAAWQDDRLNPLRGLGTANGWASQANVWTNTVPARPVKQAADGRAAGQNTSEINAATRSAASPSVQSAARQVFVQIGTFA